MPIYRLTPYGNDTERVPLRDPLTMQITATLTLAEMSQIGDAALACAAPETTAVVVERVDDRSLVRCVR